MLCKFFFVQLTAKAVITAAPQAIYFIRYVTGILKMPVTFYIELVSNERMQEKIYF